MSTHSALEIWNTCPFFDEIVEATGPVGRAKTMVRRHRKLAPGGGMLSELQHALSVPGTVLVQYDNGVGGKSFEVVDLAHLLRSHSLLLLHGRELGAGSSRMNSDFSPHHRYYNIEPNTDVRLYVDFDQPGSDPELMRLVQQDAGLFWAAVRDFTRRLGIVFPGYDAEWAAVFTSTGTKLSAHLHDLQIWAKDASLFKKTVEDALAIEGEHQQMLRGIVDLRVYHGNRAWRIPGCCKRAPDQPPRYLSLEPDAGLSGKKALELFEPVREGDKAACVSWAAFCYPHAIPTITHTDGFEATAEPTDSRKCQEKRTAKHSDDVYTPLPPGKRLKAPWT